MWSLGNETGHGICHDGAYGVAKAICPPVIGADGVLTYTFIIQNTGNTPASGDSLTVTDTFDPILRNVDVTIGGETVEINTGYTYNEATGEFATLPGAITVPAATTARDPVSGLVTVSPGSTVITVSGTVL